MENDEKTLTKRCGLVYNDGVRKKVVLHEWLSGGVSPCQGEGRGFESRLVLFYLQKKIEERV